MKKEERAGKPGKASKREAKIAFCGCVGNPPHASTYQDALYGKGNRVCNPKFAGGHTCTICGASR